MKVTIRQPDIGSSGKAVLLDKTIEQVKVPDNAVMSIDGSTTNTGVAIIQKSSGGLYFTISFTREKSQGETPVQYKVRLKRAINQILQNNTLIDTIYYEEPFIGYASAAPNLMMLRTSIEEIIVENEPLLNYIKHAEINNKHWKKLFLAPDKVPNGTELEKAAVRKKMLGYLPCLDKVSQDEIDAYAMGYTAILQIKSGNADNIESKKKPRKFQYNIRFIAAEDDDIMLMEFPDIYDGPDYLLENGVCLTTCKGTENFDTHVYKNMGNDDKVLIIKFDSNKHCNLVLQYKIGYLAATYPYIYAIVWRKTRK